MFGVIIKLEAYNSHVRPRLDQRFLVKTRVKIYGPAEVTQKILLGTGKYLRAENLPAVPSGPLSFAMAIVHASVVQ
jgi:hypothetical protein